MTNEDAFLRAIARSPDDDTLRLVYSDWLEENGRPRRAEFVRVQIELARLAEGDTRRGELEARERDLLRENERQWLGPLRAWLGGWRFRRGLLECVSLKAQTLLKHAGTLFCLAPLRHAEVHKAEKLGGALAGCRQLSRLSSLRALGLYASDAARLLASPHLGGLTSLGLPQAGLQDAGVAALADSPLLARLAELDLCCNGIRDEGVQALAASPHASRLERLDLSRNRVEEAGALALAESPALAGLKTLRLSRIWRGEWGMGLLKARFGERVQFC